MAHNAPADGSARHWTQSGLHKALWGLPGLAQIKPGGSARYFPSAQNNWAGDQSMQVEQGLLVIYWEPLTNTIRHTLNGETIIIVVICLLMNINFSESHPSYQDELKSTFVHDFDFWSLLNEYDSSLNCNFLQLRHILRIRIKINQRSWVNMASLKVGCWNYERFSNSPGWDYIMQAAELPSPFSPVAKCLWGIILASPTLSV